MLLCWWECMIMEDGRIGWYRIAGGLKDGVKMGLGKFLFLKGMGYVVLMFWLNTPLFKNDIIN